MKGFAKVIYSGVTTNHLSEIIEKCITKYNLSGLFQVSSKPISKFELLKLIKKIYKKKIKIQKSVKIKKKLILKSKKFTKKTKYLVKPWKDQIEEMRFQNNEKY